MSADILQQQQGSAESVRQPSKADTTTATPSAGGPSQNDYERTFAPFFVQSHVRMASCARFGEDDAVLQEKTREMDLRLASTQAHGTENSESISGIGGLRVRRRSPYGPNYQFPVHRYTVKQVMGQLQGSSDYPVDLTDTGLARLEPQPADILAEFPVKILQFAEDVRPPYRGTYSRLPPAKSALRLGKNPFERSLPDTEYDYDSEAEWEEPEEGEDLNSEGEEELGSDEEGDEMAGFLDDEDAADASGGGNRKRIAGGDLDPVSTGMCWENSDGKCRAALASDTPVATGLLMYKMEVILGTSIGLTFANSMSEVRD